MNNTLRLIAQIIRPPSFFIINVLLYFNDWHKNYEGKIQGTLKQMLCVHSCKRETKTLGTDIHTIVVQKRSFVKGLESSETVA